MQHPEQFAILSVVRSLTRADSSLYSFTFYPGIFLASYVYNSFYTTSVALCATQCLNDLDCNSFIYNNTDTNCSFLYDSSTSGLSNTVIPNLNSDAYVKSSFLSAVSVFAKFANSYIPGHIKTYFPGVSTTACAALCARDPLCLSFESGYNGREGDCFTSQANRATNGSVFRTNSTSSEVNYFELNSGLTRCSPGFISYTNFAPCMPCAAGTYAGSISNSQCIVCPAGTTTPGTNYTSVASCKALFCPYISTGPDATGSLKCTHHLA